MAKLKIGVLYDYWWDDDEDSRPPGARPKRQAPPRDIHDVYEALKRSGHNPVYMRIDGTRQSLEELARSETDLIFNLVESFADNDSLDSNLAGFLELLSRKFTGAGSRGLYLAQEKALAKKVFAFHGIDSPIFATAYRGRTDHAHDLKFPVIVKPAREDGSIGIDFGAVCASIKELMQRIDYIHSTFDTPALIEEYIEGRELYVGVLGNEHPEAMPIVELDLTDLPKDKPRIAGTEVKWDRSTKSYWEAATWCPDDLDDEVEERLKQIAVQAYQALELRDYGRIDFRVTPKGKIYLLEANPNPYLLPSAEFNIGVKESGRTYTKLIDEIVQNALGRYAVGTAKVNGR